MKNHKGHTILGNYCWNCQRQTAAGIPGWPKASRDDGPKDRDVAINMVVWADGVEDSQRECIVCNSSTCNMPVHNEEYGTPMMSNKVAGTMAQELNTLYPAETDNENG